MSPLIIPSFSRLPWTQKEYSSIKSPEFWSNPDVFQTGDTLSWSRYGVLFLPNSIPNSGTPGATLTYAFSAEAKHGSPSEMLRTMAKAGWRIVNMPFCKPNNHFYGELVFDPFNELDEEDEYEEQEAIDALEDYYKETYRETYGDYEFP
jgi:hypothetical protein